MFDGTGSVVERFGFHEGRASGDRAASTELYIRCLWQPVITGVGVINHVSGGTAVSTHISLGMAQDRAISAEFVAARNGRRSCICSDHVFEHPDRGGSHNLLGVGVSKNVFRK